MCPQGFPRDTEGLRCSGDRHAVRVDGSQGLVAGIEGGAEEKEVGGAGGSEDLCGKFVGSEAPR